MAEYSDATYESLRDTLEYLHDKYNRPEFVECDPISIPHAFYDVRDREIAGLLAATIAWGNRRAIVRSARRMVEYMDGAPYDFVCNASEGDLARLRTFVHRTFNGEDFIDFVRAMRSVCERYGSIGELFQERVVEELIEKIQQWMAEYNRKQGKPYQLSASFGYAFYQRGKELADCLERADQNMYRNKAQKKKDGNYPKGGAL